MKMTDSWVWDLSYLLISIIQGDLGKVLEERFGASFGGKERPRTSTGEKRVHVGKS